MFKPQQIKLLVSQAHLHQFFWYPHPTLIMLANELVLSVLVREWYVMTAPGENDDLDILGIYNDIV